MFCFGVGARYCSPDKAMLCSPKGELGLVSSSPCCSTMKPTADVLLWRRGVHSMYSISLAFVRAGAPEGPLWLSDAVAKMQSVIVKS